MNKSLERVAIFFLSTSTKVLRSLNTHHNWSLVLNKTSCSDSWLVYSKTVDLNEIPNIIKGTWNMQCLPTENCSLLCTFLYLQSMILQFANTKISLFLQSCINGASAVVWMLKVPQRPQCSKGLGSWEQCYWAMVEALRVGLVLRSQDHAPEGDCGTLISSFLSLFPSYEMNSFSPSVFPPWWAASPYPKAKGNRTSQTETLFFIN